MKAERSIAPIKGADCEAFLLCVDQKRWGVCKNQ